MAKSKQSYNKREKEKLKAKKKEDKLKKKEERKLNTDGESDSMLAWVDEFGNITSTPPDPNAKRTEIKVEDIKLGVPTREDAEEVVLEGVVTFFDTSKGFGFIKNSSSKDSYFTHVNDHLESIKEGDVVTFSIVRGQKGLNAVEVKKFKKSPPPLPPTLPPTLPIE
jgi:cold shock CspA family protein